MLKEKKVLQAKFIARAHRFDVYEGRNCSVPVWPERTAILESIEKVFPVSDDGARYLENKYGFKSKYFVSKLGVFDNNYLSKRSPDNKINIVSVSRVIEVKRVDKIFQSINHFCKHNNQFKVTWYHFGDGPKYTELKRIVNNHAINLNVCLNGNVFNKEIYDFYFNNPVDCFINLSTSEGIPVSLMEAQSFGIPIIATDVGGNSEIVKKTTGIVIPNNFRIEEVSDYIHKVITGNFSSVEIKKEWLKSFNAEANYEYFSEILANIT